MPEVICPVCERSTSVPQDKAYFGSRIQCSECKAVIEVIDEFPLRVKRYVSGGARGWMAEWLDATNVRRPAKPA